MREILFRAKRTDNGSWVNGFYVHFHKTTYCVSTDEPKDNDVHWIMFESMTDWGLSNQYFHADVDPNTVGQFTGMYDKHGKKIFEGDIVKKRTYERITPCLVKFSNGCFNCGTGWGSSTAKHPYLLNDKNIEVIGNIHDNPELLEDK